MEIYIRFKTIESPCMVLIVISSNYDYDRDMIAVCGDLLAGDDTDGRDTPVALPPDGAAQ